MLSADLDDCWMHKNECVCERDWWLLWKAIAVVLESL